MQSATPADLVVFAHAALFSPALSTLKAALDRGYLLNFMGLTSKTLTKSPPHSVAMIKGHMDQARKNQKSTKPKDQPVDSPPSPPTSTASPLATTETNAPTSVLPSSLNPPVAKSIPTKLDNSSWLPAPVTITFSCCTTTTASAPLINQ